jgi:putative hydrolase of the HAD superfamily
MKEYKRLCKEVIEGRWERHSEIKVEDIFARIRRERASWPINDVTVGIEAARIFRSSSIRRLQAFPQSIRLLETLRSYPLGVVSNGQRVFSENELRPWASTTTSSSSSSPPISAAKNPTTRYSWQELRGWC